MQSFSGERASARLDCNTWIQLAARSLTPDAVKSGQCYVYYCADDLMNDDLTPSVSSWLTSGGESVGVEKTGENTVVFYFSTPNGLFLQNLASILVVQQQAIPATILSHSGTN